MRKNYSWKEHAKDTTKKIAEMEMQSPLGLYCEPDEYLETLENFTKLLFDMNKVPDNFIVDLENLDADWSRFKFRLGNFCRSLYEELEKDSENSEDE